ncbi:SusC/RagA family TonB-linked outer membrane protein [Pedobacter lusitanus]|uniref:SusC/RagA family TonB-linked outer membrane protein n=1 Tax=Pedobacter lusitanus TaxID=1503925 RepID=UPI0009E2EDB3|nr:TonB-dependent receptor [Pedobacter lusitanus]
MKKKIILLIAFLFTGFFVATAQDIQVNGIVKDSQGLPLPGVSIKLMGAAKATSTSANGAFSISVPATGTLIFTSIGFITKQLPVNSRRQIDLIMEADNTNLDEVVVIGYGSVKKGDLTGSVASIGSKEIKATPVASLSQAIQGRAAGVRVSQSSNAPGGGMNIRIRGGNSIQGGNEPLYVIDGYPLYNENGPGINPNDIESMEILKDASAAAIYGSRGANGVIIITTKRGKAGANRIQFESYYGSQTLRKKIDLLDASQLATLVNDGIANVNGDNIGKPGYPKPLTYTDAQIAALGKGTDWQDEVFRTAPIQNYQLTFTGGTEKSQYAVSGNYFNQKGIVSNSGYKRGSVRVNLDQQLSSKFKFSNSLTVTNSSNNSVATDGDGGGNAGVIYSALFFSPTVPVYDAQGQYSMNNRQGGILISNPLALANERTNIELRTRILGNTSLEYKIIDGLTFKTMFGANMAFSKTNFYLPRTVYAGLATNGRAEITTSRYFEWLNENTLNYKKVISEIHSFNFLVGYTFQNADFEDLKSSAQNFASDILKFNNLGAAQQTNPNTSNAYDWSLRSYLGRINYDLSNKYLFTISGRYDGSSRFGMGKKYSFFPSGSAAWRLSGESFMSKLKAVSDLKLRASYGITGNQEIGQYQSLGALQTESYNFGNVIAIGYAPNRIANPDLKWETTAQLNFGLDLGLFKNRITVTTDWYQKKTKDLLYNVSLPITSGFTTSLQNIGKVKNEGFEFAINTVNLNGAFQWNTNFNISFNKNEILDLGSVTDDIPSGGASGHLQLGSSGILRVGQPIGVFYGLVTDGIFQNAAEVAASGQKNAKPGERRYKDVVPDGVINSLDRVILGHAQPDYTFGFTNNFSYKGFDLSVFIQGVQGNSIFNLNRYEMESMTGVSNQSVNVLDRWTPTNPSNNMPRASSAGSPYQVTSQQVEDGSYIRLKNVQLGYNFSPELLKKNQTIQCKDLYQRTEPFN